MIFKKAQPVAYMKEKQQQQQHAKAELARVEREKADRIRSEHAKAEQAKAEQLRLEVENLKLERSNQISRQNQSGRNKPSTARTSADPGNQVSARPDNVSPKPSPAKQNLSQKVNTEQKLKELASLGILKKDLPLFCSWQDACISAHLANAQPLKTLNSRAISKAISQAKEKGQSQKLISLLVTRLSMAKKEEDRQARIRAEEERKQAEIKRLASIIDGTYIPTESEITRPCKELAEENSVTGQIDWGWFGVANAQYNREQRLVTLEGRSKNPFGVKIPFTIMCQWEKGGVVRVVDIKHGHGG